jgi:hypothetical protein
VDQLGLPPRRRRHSQAGEPTSVVVILRGNISALQERETSVCHRIVWQQKSIFRAKKLPYFGEHVIEPRPPDRLAGASVPPAIWKDSQECAEIQGSAYFARACFQVVQLRRELAASEDYERLTAQAGEIRNALAEAPILATACHFCIDRGRKMAEAKVPATRQQGAG